MNRAVNKKLFRFHQTNTDAGLSFRPKRTCFWSWWTIQNPADCFRSASVVNSAHL